MGIALISSPANALAAMNGDRASTGASSAEGETNVFASLFAEQLDGLNALFAAGTPGILSKESKEKLLPGEEEMPLDPGQILAAFLPLTPTTSAPATPAREGGDSPLTAQNSALPAALATAVPEEESPALATSDAPAQGPTLLAEPEQAEANAISSGKSLPADFAASRTDPQPPATFGQHLASAQAVSTQAAGTASSSTHLSTPIHDAKWAPDFGNKLVWMAKNELQSAQLTLNPPQLGPLQINLNLSGDQASALFVSPHAEVRQAIQDAMPQLREMLAGAGIDLGQANVGSQWQAKQEQSSGFSSGRPASGTATSAGDTSPEAARGTIPPAASGRGLVDLFA